MKLGRTNGEVLDLHRSLVIEAVVERLNAIMACDDEEALRQMSAAEYVELGLTDEVRVFVKNELHSDVKVKQGRMRIIMSISLLDQLVERVLNGPQNNAEIAKWETIPSKPGMGLHDEGLASLERQIRALGNPVSSDISGFDWSVQQWMLDLDAEVRSQLCGANRLSHMHAVRAILLGKSRFVFSDGVVWDQEFPGIQKSGSYNTSSTNSRIRVMCGWLVAKRRGEVPAIIAMGDDAVENSTEPEMLREEYAKLGFEIKEVSTDIEFCAYAYDMRGGYKPVRWHKMLATFLTKEPRDDDHAKELVCAAVHELRHSPHLQRLAEAIRVSGWGTRKDNQ